MRKSVYGSMVATLLLFSPAAFADKGNGQAFYEPTVWDTVELADGRVISRITLSGFVIGSSAKNPFHMTNQHCSGTSIAAPGQSEPTGYGYCEGFDRDGDAFFISWRTGPGDDTWQLLGGTGKFAGISGGGTSETTHTWADGKYAINWDGNWTMK